MSNPFLDFSVESSFEGVNRLFVVSFENQDDRKVPKKHYLTTTEIKDYSIVIDNKTFLIKNQLKVILEHMITCWKM